jgi:hypothetical protein
MDPMQSQITEMALRTAISAAPKLLSNDPHDTIEQISTLANKRAAEIVNANGTSGAIGSQKSLQTTAIEIAIKGIEQAYILISNQLKETQNKRLSFDKERQAGIASFIIPTNREEGHFSNQEYAINSFIELSQKNPCLYAYMGVQEGTLPIKHNARYFAVLPFYRMSEELQHPIASARAIEKQRNSINLFFKSALHESLSCIDAHFQTDTRLGAFILSSYHGHNYLNDLRAPRFIMIALSNLLWNLQHPVDHQTGVPISLHEAKNICREVQLFLNHILDDDLPPFLSKIGKISLELISFVRKIEIHVKELYFAYIDEIINEINIEDVTNSAHHVLRIMDKSILKLLYRVQNPISLKTEPNDKAAEELAYTINYLNQLINHNPEIIQKFLPFREYLVNKAENEKHSQDNPETAVVPNSPTAIKVINTVPYTVIDSLVIFCHLTHDIRMELYASIASLNVDSAREFVKTLQGFKQKFINPLKAVHRNQKDGPLFFQSEMIARESAKRFIPLMTLVIEDYRVDVDRRPEVSTNDSDSTGELNGMFQTQKINASAALPNSYYIWNLSPYLSLTHHDAITKIDNFPAQQYKITQVTVLLDAVAELITKYQSFLQDKAFQEFLKRFLSEVKNEYSLLEKYIDDLDKIISSSEIHNRGLIGVLRRMLDDLQQSLDRIQHTIENLAKTVDSPEFIDKQRMILDTKINTIKTKYEEIFGKDALPSKGLMIANSGHLFTREQNRLEGNKFFEKFKLTIPLNANMLSMIKRIPPETKVLDLSCNKLGEKSTVEIQEAFTHLSPELNSLDLSGNFFEKQQPHSLVYIFKTLPDSILSLNLSWNNFGIAPDKLNCVIQNIPKNIQSLNLSRTNLSSLSLDDFIKLIESLPRNIRHLSLSNNTLATKKCEELSEIFSKLTNNIDLLDLSGNLFDTKTGQGLGKLFKNLPQSINILDLSANELGRVNIEDLEISFSYLPANLKKIDLSGNSFYNQSANQLKRVFERLPFSLIRIILSHNHIGRMQADDITGALKALPHAIEELDLSYNDLSNFSDEEFITIIKSVECGLKKLNLYGNNLGSKSSDCLSSFIINLPNSLEYLNLGRNDLVQLSGEELKALMSSFKKNISILCLNHNDFGLKENIEDLVLMMQGLTDKISVLELKNNQLSSLSVDDLCLFLLSIPNSVKKLSLSNNNLGDKTAQELEKIFKHMPKQLELLDLSLNQINSKTHVKACLQLPNGIQKVVFDIREINVRAFQLANTPKKIDKRMQQASYSFYREFVIMSLSIVAITTGFNMLLFGLHLINSLLLIGIGLLGGYQSYRDLNKNKFFDKIYFNPEHSNAIHQGIKFM